MVGSILFEELISAFREFMVELGLQAMIFRIDRNGDGIAIAICRGAPSRGVSRKIADFALRRGVVSIP